MAVEAPTLLCAKCGGAADGWKCAICGSVAREHDEHHLHSGRTGTARSDAPHASRRMCIARAYRTLWLEWGSSTPQKGYVLRLHL